MFKLENYSLKRRMQIVAGLGIVFLMLVLGVFWYLETSGAQPNNQITILTIFTAIVGALLYLIATYIGNVGMARANMLVAGIQNIKKGDLTQKISISGKSDFSWMAFELDNTHHPGD